MGMLIMIAAAVLVVALIAGGLILRRRPRQINTDQLQEQWREMQKLLANKETWQQAVVDADKLLDSVLKKKKFAGKTMGERLTKAQRTLSDNEGVWFGHKLRNRIESEPDAKLKESDVKQALMGIRQALKDLGAFPNGK
jgi:uncharacterized membrane-anchored protein YhcB (DUF1043 family)